MTITVSLREIKDAQESLNVEDYESYLEVQGNIIYLNWVTDRKTAQMYIDNVYQCVDIKIHGQWVDISGKEPFELPILRDGGYFDCRYILATRLTTGHQCNYIV